MMMTLIGLVGNWNSTLTAQLVSPDSLYLNEDLPEINIVAVKPLIKAEADKTTYSIAEDPDSRTYTLLEMLQMCIRDRAYGVRVTRCIWALC